MRAGVINFAILAVVALANLARGEPLDIGASLFNGSFETGTRAIVGGAAVPAARFPCRSCHGRDGTGRREGGAPSIQAVDLFRSTPARPAYDRASLQLALREGHASDGRNLAKVMPRYDLDEAAFTSMADYLDKLADLQKRGIYPRSIVVGVAIPADNAKTAKRYAEALEAALKSAFSDRSIHGREISVERLEGSPDEMVNQARNVAAVIGLAPSALITPALFIDKEIPVLFPLYPLDGGEDPTIVRGVMADRPKVLTAIAERLVADKVTRVGVLDAAGCGTDADTFIRRFSDAGIAYQRIMLSEPTALYSDTTDPIVLLCTDRRQAKAILNRLPTDVRIYGIASELLHGIETKRGRMVLAFPEGALLAQAGKPTLLDAHASISARLLATAMTAAGRNVSRNTLVSSVGAFQDSTLGLNFSSDAVKATGEVTFIETTSTR